MKLIILPLAILMILSVIGVAGSLSESAFGKIGVDAGTNVAIYYDSGGTPVVYSNGTATGYAGTGTITSEPVIGGPYAYWNNATLIYYHLYWDNAGARMIEMSDVGKTTDTPAFMANITLNDMFMYVGLLIGLMGLVTVVGLRILGNGISDISVDGILKITAYYGLWGSLTVGAYGLFQMVPYSLGLMFFLALTITYTLGVINSIGHPAGD